MSGQFTRRTYDPCVEKHETRQSTRQLGYNMDINRFVHANNACEQTGGNYGHARLIELDSALAGLDRPYSNCDSDKYPFCGPKGCRINQARFQIHNSPYLNERGTGGIVVAPTNPKANRSSGIPAIRNIICNDNSGSDARYAQTQSRLQRPNLGD